jgi:glycosyltransferase involved in cell wall biosynthesis
MAILFGHPTGSPFAHHAALAHFEAGQLDRVCISWMPSKTTLRILEQVPPLRAAAQRLSRRHFSPLADAPKVQGRLGELKRLAIRAFGRGDADLANEANEWLMRAMARECRRRSVSAVHSYEDCSLWQFQEAKRLGKACIYDMPIGYYSAWERIEAQLASQYGDWMPDRPAVQRFHPEQKRREIELADVVLVPSEFVADTVRDFHPKAPIAVAPYGVDLGEWPARTRCASAETVIFLFVGQCSVRKGVPLLLQAWRAAGLIGARLELVGPWLLAEGKKRELPPQTRWRGAVSSRELRRHYRNADIFVFPTNFEGRALVVGEASASGLPVLTTAASGADDFVDNSSGRIVPANDLDALVEELRWFDQNREQLPELSRAARLNAERCTWAQYRSQVTAAVRPLV